MHERTDEYRQLKTKEDKTTGALVPVDLWYEISERAKTFRDSITVGEISTTCFYMAARRRVDPDRLRDLAAAAYQKCHDIDWQPEYWLSKLYDEGARKYSPNGWRNPEVARPVTVALLAAWRHGALHCRGSMECEHDFGPVSHLIPTLWQLGCAYHNIQKFREDPGVCDVEVVV